MAIKIAIFVDFLTVLLISANTGQYQMQNIHVQNISISWRWCGAQLRIHQFYKFAKPPHVSNHHQNIILQFLDFTCRFHIYPRNHIYSCNQLKLNIIKDAPVIFYTASIQLLFFAPILNFDASRVKRWI